MSVKNPVEIAEQIAYNNHAYTALIREIAAAIQAERLAIWGKICIHHTDAERAAITCPVCLKRRLDALEAQP